jgi:hypothetical protein
MPDLPPVATLTTTRTSLHQVAEHVLSAALKRATGAIGLVPAAGGFATPRLPDGRVIAVHGVAVLVSGPEGTREQPLTTVRAAAALAGVEPGFPWTKHRPATQLEPDAELTIDPVAAAALAGWFALGAVALARLAGELAGRASDPLIFPEHFDLGLTADGVNYGASPGDDLVPLPYVYVGPHTGPPANDDFWNAPFGAYRTADGIDSSDQALAFFREARTRLG